MSQYNTDEGLSMMEGWIFQRKELPDFNEGVPLKGFDRLRGKDLTEVDLSKNIIQSKAQTWSENNFSESGPRPSWLAYADRGIDLRGADLSLDADGTPDTLSRAILTFANLEGPTSRAPIFEMQT